MRFFPVLLASVFLASCGHMMRYPKPSMPGRPCPELCLRAERNCLGHIGGATGGAFLWIFWAGGNTEATNVRECAVDREICQSECAQPLVDAQSASPVAHDAASPPASTTGP